MKRCASTVCISLVSDGCLTRPDIAVTAGGNGRERVKISLTGEMTGILIPDIGPAAELQFLRHSKIVFRMTCHVRIFFRIKNTAGTYSWYEPDGFIVEFVGATAGGAEKAHNNNLLDFSTSFAL
jgi:hypothetical protein